MLKEKKCLIHIQLQQAGTLHTNYHHFKNKIKHTKATDQQAKVNHKIAGGNKSVIQIFDSRLNSIS